MTLADRIVVMRHGRIEQVGTPMEIYHEPANQFVASFFGSPAMNLIPGAGLTVGSRRAFAFGENVWPLDGLAHVPEGPATLGVRPEAIRVGDGARFTAQVTLVEPLGKETLIYLQYEPDRFLIAIAGGEFTAEEGTTVQFDFQGARLYLFDADGQRIDAGVRRS